MLKHCVCSFLRNSRSAAEGSVGCLRGAPGRMPSAERCFVTAAKGCILGKSWAPGLVAPVGAVFVCQRALGTTDEVGSLDSAARRVHSLDTFTYHRRLEETEVALVCFTSPGCGSCRAFTRVLPLLQRRADEKQRAGYGFQLAVFEVDAGENMGLVNELDVVDLPALFVYVNGEFHCPLQAAPEAEVLYMAVVRASKQPASEPP
mmetsp:Transcript_114500/g.334761  ORF Transcript_114500/g.334761 Transcript_114500/m.334761 type:complete len:204 (-) Transcript_114500:297-908(-)